MFYAARRGARLKSAAQCGVRGSIFVLPEIARAEIRDRNLREIFLTVQGRKDTMFIDLSCL